MNGARRRHDAGQLTGHGPAAESGPADPQEARPPDVASAQRLASAVGNVAFRGLVQGARSGADSARLARWPGVAISYTGQNPPQKKKKESFNRELYEKKLNEAVQKLSSANFGRAEQYGEKINPNPTWFEKNKGVDKDTKAEWFDTRYWERVIQGNKLRLRLKDGKRPSDAIDALFARLDDWSIDCMQFEQIAQLYARRWSMLPEPDHFNEVVAPEVMGFQPKQNYLDQHGSFGMESGEIYERELDSQPFTRRSDKKTFPPAAAWPLVQAMPVGSRIVWVNAAADKNDIFRNENAIKLGPDKFAAHGFQSKKNPSKNIFTRDELELALARATNPAGDAAYAKKVVFIGWIERYELPKSSS